MIGYVIGLIVVGLIVGALGRLVHPGHDPLGIGVTILIGIGASLVAGLLVGGALGFVLAVVVAAALVGLVSGASGRRLGRRSL